MAANLFQQPARPQGNVHVEFRAGKCTYEGKMIKPQKTKGKIVLVTKDDEAMTYFQWWDRETNSCVDEYVVINDAYLEKIEKCKDGRVYVMRWTSGENKLFFWMQEPKTDGDVELIKKFNEAIGAEIPATKPASGAAGAAQSTAQNQNLDPALRAVLNTFLQGQGAAGGGAERTPPIPVAAVLTTEVLQSLLQDEAATKEMCDLLPEGQQTPEDLKKALASPQLQQCMNSLTQAVHSDQLPVLFASLGLNPNTIQNAAPGSDAMEVLCRAMEAQPKPNP